METTLAEGARQNDDHNLNKEDFFFRKVVGIFASFFIVSFVLLM